MKRLFQKETKQNMDYMLFLFMGILVIFGLVILYSTSSYNGRVKFHDPSYYFKKQLFATALGLLCLYIVSCMDYHWILKFAPVLYAMSLVLSGLVLVVGDAYNGSRRWLSVGPLSFQPAEYAKVAVILFLTFLISKKRRKRREHKIWFAGRVLLWVLPIVGLVGTNNLSTAVIILGIAVLLIFVSDPDYLKFIWIGVLGAGFVGIFLSLESYRLERLAVWRNPESYDKGFQTIQGLYAIGSGGIFGTGLGNSLQKLGFVPEAQNDMIFSVICEELGLVGALFTLAVFACVIWRLWQIAFRAVDYEGLLIAGGILIHIALQVVLNIAVVTNTIPNTGITLPFISYGGTSVLFLLGELGLALSVSRSCRT